MRIKQIAEQGGLVDDKTVTELLIKHLLTLPPHYIWILDVFPRSEEQAKFLGESTDIQITHIIELSCPLPEVIERICGRLYDPVTCKTYHKIFNKPPTDIIDRLVVRKDDSEEVVRKRYAQYEAAASAVRSHFKDVKFVNTSGRGIEDIH